MRELRVAQVVEGLGPLVVGAQRVGRGAREGLLRLVEALGAAQGIAQIVGRLERAGGGLQRPLVALDGARIVAAGVGAVAPAHEPPFGQLLGARLGGDEEQQDIWEESVHG